MFLEGMGICHKCERKTAKGMWLGSGALAEAGGWEPTLDGSGLNWSWELQALTSRSLPCFWPRLFLAASDSCLVEVEGFGRRRPAGAEGVQHPGVHGCCAGGQLVVSFAPVIKAEKPSMPDLNSSASDSAFQGGLGAGWRRRREGCLHGYCQGRGWLLREDLHSRSVQPPPSPRAQCSETCSKAHS